MFMDPALQPAAWSGDVGFLVRAISTRPADYFCTVSDDYIEGNIFHIAACRSKTDFLREARKRLPAEVQQVLYSQQSEKLGWNPLHMAAWVKSDSLEIVRLILGFYKSYSGLPLPVPDHKKPWLALSQSSTTPLHEAIATGVNEDSAMEILSMDMELLCGMVDTQGNSPLFLAVKNGLNRVAEKILMSSCSYSVSADSDFNSTSLHFAPKCSERVLTLLLEKHLELINTVDNNGFSVLHQWAEIEEVWPLSLLLEGNFLCARTKVFRDFIYMADNKEGDTPLHIAAKTKNTDFVRALVCGYQQELKAGEMLESIDCPPWKVKNKNGDTPLHLVLSLKHEELSMYFVSLDSTLCQILNDKGESPLLLAVAAGFGQVVEEILRTQDARFHMLCRNDGVTVLHLLQFCPEETGKRLLGKFWWILNLPDNMGRTALDEAKEANIPWLVDLLRNPSLVQKEPFDWITACERSDEIPAVLAFIDNCRDLQRVCREQNDTPLHHIKLPSYKEYLNFLKIPTIAELKNTTDSEGATPLHIALKRKDMLLAKALLIDDGVERNVEDFHGKTAMHLLAELCKENDDWAKMCKQIKVNPHLKTTYIRHGTNLDQMRNTLSVVAALLATITFAAGFTLPGGLKSETGEAMLAKKPAFLVFLLADAYAMCTSMLVLFCLIWSMISDHHTSYLLVDRCVLVLMQSLYGTMVAFMTGIYTVIEHSSLWAAIVIFVMCSLIGISANRTILHSILANLVPAANQEQRDRIQLLEEGKAYTSGDDDSQKTK